MFLIVCEDENGPELTTYPNSIFRISGTYCSPTLFFCMSLVDIMTLLQKKIYRNLGTLFGYLQSKVKVNDLCDIISPNCHAMYMSG